MLSEARRLLSHYGWMCRAQWPGSTDQFLVVCPYNRSGVSVLDLHRGKEPISELPWAQFDECEVMKPVWDLNPVEHFCRISWTSGMCIDFDKLREEYNPHVYALLSRLLNQRLKNESSIRPVLLRLRPIIQNLYMEIKFDAHAFVKACTKRETGWVESVDMILNELPLGAIEYQLKKLTEHPTLAKFKYHGGYLPSVLNESYSAWLAGKWTLEQLFFGVDALYSSGSI